MYDIFVVPGNEQALLGMPDIEILNIFTISCNTISTEEADKEPIAVQTHQLPIMQEMDTGKTKINDKGRNMHELFMMKPSHYT